MKMETLANKKNYFQMPCLCSSDDIRDSDLQDKINPDLSSWKVRGTYGSTIEFPANSNAAPMLLRLRSIYAIIFAVLFLFLTAISLLSDSKTVLLVVETDDYVQEKPERIDNGDIIAKTNSSSFPGIYVREAYRVKDNLIRLVYLEHRDNLRPLTALIDSQWHPVRWFCFNKSCNDYLFCDIATRIGALELPTGTANIETMDIAARGNDEYFKIPVRDVRIKPTVSTYPYSLGVCLQPIFFYTDWPLIVQFFESWLAQGGTKFYFYIHSYSKQTKVLLDFYKRELGDSLELIHWSDLPVHERDRGNYYKDANGHVFRHGATAFMHDCMLRARSNVKWIANFDLDDFPFALSGDISSTLNSITENQPNTAQVVVDWRLAKQKLDWDRIRTPRDVSLSLSSVKLMSNDSVRWDYRVSNKMFHRPERSLHFDMHSVYKNEKIPGSETRYETFHAGGDKRIFSLHLRRFERHTRSEHVKLDTHFDYQQLEPLSRKMQENYENRIRRTDFEAFAMAPWAVESRQTMRDLEQCRREAFGVKLTGNNQICQQSSAGCAGMLSASAKFETASQSWIDVAHTATFNSYIEKS